ncbi:MAG TPA: hypothetical protein VFM96_07435, partial [Gaiellaceae bacterium]|nr:hypothetical protein [Gaiellaceae bacterium]
MNATAATALAHFTRGRSYERASVRWLAFWLLLATLPLETVLVVATAFTIPPYIYLLPVLLGLTLWSASLRDATPSKPVAIAVAVWVTVNVLSLIVWVVDRPPRPHILALYGSLRAGPFRGVFQLAIAVAFLLALPLTAMLAKGRERYAVAIFVGGAAVIALYGVYQSYAEFWRLPLQTLSNDPLTASRGNSAVLGINRARSTFGEPASFGDYVLGPLALATSLAIWGRGRARAVATVASAVLWAAMVLTISVTTWFAAVISAIVLVPAIVHSRAWRPALSAVGLAAVIAFVVIWPFVASTPSPASATPTTTASATTTSATTTASTPAPTTTAPAPTTTAPPPTTAAAPTTTAPATTTSAPPRTTTTAPTTKTARATTTSRTTTTAPTRTAPATTTSRTTTTAPTRTAPATTTS